MSLFPHASCHTSSPHDQLGPPAVVKRSRGPVRAANSDQSFDSDKFQKDLEDSWKKTTADLQVRGRIEGAPTQQPASTMCRALGRLAPTAIGSYLHMRMGAASSRQAEPMCCLCTPPHAPTQPLNHLGPKALSLIATTPAFWWPCCCWRSAEEVGPE
jgi:hypothetical protein